MRGSFEDIVTALKVRSVSLKAYKTTLTSWKIPLPSLVKLCRYARVRSTTTFLPGGMPYHYFYGGKKLRDLCIWSVDAACRENVLVCINQARESITM